MTAPEGPTISLCLMARKPAPRVRALLELMRPVVDEIVVAIDRTGDPALPAACADLADRSILVEPAPLNRWIGWLHAQCSADWILRLEDDEVPSAALVGGLRAAVARRAPTHVALTRRWLYPDPERFISSHPWRPDYQVRLVRNVPGLLRFPGRLHAPIEVLGERRHLALAVYHCDLLLDGVQARRAKAARYEQVRAVTTSDGVPVNSMYVPEDRSGVETAPVPAEDLRLIERVDAGSPHDPGATADPPHAPALERADRHTGARTVPADAYGARLNWEDPPSALARGGLTYHEVVAENLGAERWPWAEAGPPLIRLAHRWLDGAGGLAAPEGPRTAFTETVEPGEATRAMLAVRAPDTPGRFELEVDVVHEHVRWFGCGLRTKVDVL